MPVPTAAQTAVPSPTSPAVVVQPSSQLKSITAKPIRPPQAPATMMAENASTRAVKDGEESGGTAPRWSSTD